MQLILWSVSESVLKSQDEDDDNKDEERESGKAAISL